MNIKKFILKNFLPYLCMIAIVSPAGNLVFFSDFQSAVWRSSDLNAFNWGSSKEKKDSNEVLIRVIENNRGVKGVMARFEVSASKEKIWAMLTDNDNIQNIYDNINKVKILSSDNKGAYIEYWLDTLAMETHYVLNYEYVKKYYSLKWHRVSGDMKTITGSWQIKVIKKNKVQLTYKCFVVADGAFARFSNWAIERWAQDEAKKMVDSMLKYLENKV